MEIVATGAPRSGTRYLASVLGWAHEQAYGLDETGQIRQGPAVWPEVSWTAAPVLNPSRTLIIHLIRHPVATVASIIANNWLHPGEPWAEHAHRYTRTWDPWLFWLRWTQIADEIAHTRIRLEDIAHLGPALNHKTTVPLLEIPDEHRDQIGEAAHRYGYSLQQTCI